MFKLFGNKKAKGGGEGGEAGPEAQKGRRLLLHVGGVGWRAMLSNADGEWPNPPRTWDGLELEAEEGRDRVHQVLENAIAANGDWIKKADRIGLLVDEIGVHFADQKTRELRAPSGATLQEYGKSLLHVENITFGFAPMIQQAGRSGDRTREGLFGFADAGKLRSLISLFDIDGTKIDQVIPKSYLIARRGLINPNAPYGALYVGGWTSNLILVNPAIGGISVRAIPVGAYTLIQAVAEANGISLEDARRSLAAKDCLEAIRPAGAETDEEGALDLGLNEQALQPLMTDLRQRMADTLAFFTYQRALGRIGSLEVIGEAGGVAGLNEWLSAHLELEMHPVETPLVEMFAAERSPMDCNLLKGASSSLLSVGKTRYFFSEEKGFTKQRAEIKPVAASAAGGPKSAAPKGRGRGRGGSGRQGGRGGGRRAPAQRGRAASADGGLGAQLAALFRKGGDAQATADGDLDPAEQRKEALYFALFGIMAIALLYWGYDHLATVARKHAESAKSYLEARGDNGILIGRLQAGGDVTIPVSTDVNKVLWTEKFLALAKHIDEHIWLTDVYLDREEREVGAAVVETSKIVIHGRVLPSTDGHIQKIAAYMDRLMKDVTGFMADFRSVRFMGAQLEQDRGDEVVTFTLEALYDQNKRIEQDTAGGGVVGGVSSTVNSAVGAREERMQQARGGGV